MTWLLVALWGTVVGLDATSAVQSMVSRPLVAATVTGLIIGEPAEAVLVGIILELFSLVILPIGAARYPESGTGAVAAAFAYGGVAAPASVPGLLLLAVVFGLFWERLAGLSVVALRRINGWLVAEAPARAVPSARRLERLHLAALALDGVRAGVIVLGGAFFGQLLLTWLGPYWSFDGEITLRALAIAGATMLGATLSLFGGWTARRSAFIVGIICGSILLLVR
jgi:PTS system mannose-specific IIC component